MPPAERQRSAQPDAGAPAQDGNESPRGTPRGIGGYFSMFKDGYDEIVNAISS